jgi:hypothetical protein
MGSILKRVVLACIVASALSQVAAAAEALHVLLEHGGEHGRPAPIDAAMSALHGHAHTLDTPEHDHPVTAPAPGSAAPQARGPLQRALPAGCGETWASRPSADLAATGARTANPRPTPATPTVLRI